jgi:hypothetical protein
MEFFSELHVLNHFLGFCCFKTWAKPGLYTYLTLSMFIHEWLGAIFQLLLTEIAPQVRYFPLKCLKIKISLLSPKLPKIIR